jgi:DNA-binding winged helix-turn-helix (wHTH) protein
LLAPETTTVTFEFGLLQIDEPARVVRLGGRDVPLQPRIFDLLAYLVRHRTRVVPKDELLDMLWPGVTVTENSLQRAVSVLRATLREVGLEEAVRNFPRNGYRFCTDSLDPMASAPPATVPPAGTEADESALAAARRATEGQRWAEAADGFAAQDGLASLSGADLSRWALALQCLGRPSAAIPVLMRAIATHTRNDDPEAAAIDATALSAVHLERGEVAVAAGWLSQAAGLLADRPETAATGCVLWMRSRLTATEGYPEKAVELAAEAHEIGRRRNDVRVTSLGLMYRGFYRLSLGRTRDGLADQDHAAAMALSHGVDPITGSTLYCNVLWACRTFGDWARASQWTESYQSFCLAGGMQVTGSCQLHRAEVLGVRGTLAEALAHVNEALARLSGDAPWALGDAHRVLGDIHAAMGNARAAHEAFQACYGLGWDPEPGYAMLRLEEGDAEAALAGLERSLIGQSWWTLQRQGMLLAHLAVVSSRAGRHLRAQALVEDLAGQDDRWPMPSIRALTNEASALLAEARGDRAGALRHLHLARHLWTSIDARIEAARLRVLIAERLLDQDDPSGAATEMRAACVAAESLDSPKLHRQCRALRLRLGEDSRDKTALAPRDGAHPGR